LFVSYPTRPLTTPKPKKEYMTNPNLENPRQKWTTFTYIGKETTYITDIYICTYILKSPNMLLINV